MEGGSATDLNNIGIEGSLPELQRNFPFVSVVVDKSR